MKLQDAYFSEQNQYGGWGLIGYTAPGTGSSVSFKGTTFTYGIGADALAWNSETTNAVTAAWQAENTETALNDCAKNNIWQINTKAATKLVTEYEAKAPTDNNCKVLTPSFEKIGK